MPKSKKRKSAGEAQRRAEVQDRQAGRQSADAHDAGLTRAEYDANDERELYNAGFDLLKALYEYQAVARKYQQGEGLLELDEEMGRLAWASHGLEQELVQLGRAIEVIEEDIPIAAQSEQGRAWKPRLSPRWLQYFLGLAKPGDTGYVPQLMALIEKDKARELDAECGRTTKSGSECKAVPVYWPGRGRNSACGRHLTDDEKSSLEDVWSGIEQSRECPGCTAQPGKACSEDASALVLVNGEWPRIRSFAGRRMHDARLELV